MIARGCSRISAAARPQAIRTWSGSSILRQWPRYPPGPRSSTPSACASINTTTHIRPVGPMAPADAAENAVADGPPPIIQRAGCLIIGDEVLNGKTVDTNSAYLAKFCFSLGINLSRIEVVPDEEDDIIESVRRLSDRCDVVVTSGGIGPTHDDITYGAMAKAFGLTLRLHDETFARMKALSVQHPSQQHFSWDTPSPALTAKLRMAQLPDDELHPERNQVLFVDEDLWVPISVVHGNVYILPGVPRLFTRLLDGLKPVWRARVPDGEGSRITRLLFSTPLAESEIAAYLTELAAKVQPRGVKVGSYPRWGKRHNTVTLVGRDPAFLKSLVPEVEQGVQGHRIATEDEDDSSSGSGSEGPA